MLGRISITECFALEGTFKGHAVQPHCHEQGHLQKDHVTQNPIQPYCEGAQRLGFYHLSWQFVQVHHHSRNKNFLACFQSLLTLF